MTKPLADHFRLLARYNTGANKRLYDACTKLTDEYRKTDRKGFFHSIHGTLNHLLVGDRVWMARFEGGTSPTTGLDALLFVEFDALRTARMAEDERITTFVESLDDDYVAG